LPYKEQIDDQNVDKFRPPGIFKVRESRSVVKLPAITPQKDLSSSKSMPMMFINNEVPSFGNADVEEKQRLYKEKVERQIWQCVPDRRLYRRDVVISELETRANAKRFEKWEAPVMPVDQKASPNKNARRGGAQGGSALNQYGSKPSLGSGKTVEFAANSRVPRRDPEELYKIRLDSIDP